ncbi:MAG: hypothetical protein HDS30_06970 [Bacteroides sp.]|nr:hypothetical protein [Bacteroides sp.]
MTINISFAEIAERVKTRYDVDVELSRVGDQEVYITYVEPKKVHYRSIKVSGYIRIDEVRHDAVINSGSLEKEAFIDEATASKKKIKPITDEDVASALEWATRRRGWYRDPFPMHLLMVVNRYHPEGLALNDITVTADGLKIEAELK